MFSLCVYSLYPLAVLISSSHRITICLPCKVNICFYFYPSLSLTPINVLRLLYSLHPSWVEAPCCVFLCVFFVICLLAVVRRMGLSVLWVPKLCPLLLLKVIMLPPNPPSFPLCVCVCLHVKLHLTSISVKESGASGSCPITTELLLSPSSCYATHPLYSLQSPAFRALMLRTHFCSLTLWQNVSFLQETCSVSAHVLTCGFTALLSFRIPFINTRSCSLALFCVLAKGANTVKWISVSSAREKRSVLCLIVTSDVMQISVGNDTSIMHCLNMSDL